MNLFENLFKSIFFFGLCLNSLVLSAQEEWEKDRSKFLVEVSSEDGELNDQMKQVIKRKLQDGICNVEFDEEATILFEEEEYSAQGDFVEVKKGDKFFAKIKVVNWSWDTTAYGQYITLYASPRSNDFGDGEYYEETGGFFELKPRVTTWKYVTMTADWEGWKDLRATVQTPNCYDRESNYDIVLPPILSKNPTPAPTNQKMSTNAPSARPLRNMPTPMPTEADSGSSFMPYAVAGAGVVAVVAVICGVKKCFKSDNSSRADS